MLKKRLLDAIEEVTSRRPHVSTAIRWRTRGCRGIRLEAEMIGGQWFTTTGAVKAFVDATNSARLVDTKFIPEETPGQAKRRADRSAKLLAKRLGA